MAELSVWKIVSLHGSSLCSPPLSDMTRYGFLYQIKQLTNLLIVSVWESVCVFERKRQTVRGQRGASLWVCGSVYLIRCPSWHYSLPVPRAQNLFPYITKENTGHSLSHQPEERKIPGEDKTWLKIGNTLIFDIFLIRL